MTDINLEDKNIRALLESEVINTLLHKKTFFNLVIHHLEKRYFTEPGMRLLFENTKDYYLEFGKVPSLKELILSFKDASKTEKELIKKSIKEIKEPSETNEDMLLKQTEFFIKDAIFSEAIILGADALGEHDHQKKMESYQLAEESVKISLNDDLGTSLEEIDKRFEEYGPKHGVKLGIKSFDKYIGDGYVPKTLHIIMAASGVGKSAMLCSFATQFLIQKRDVVLISLEMSESEFYKRIDSNLFDVEIKSLATIEKQVIKMKYKEIKDDIGQLIVKEFPSGSLSALGLDGYLSKLENERGIKNPIVMVDYLSLMKSDRMKNSDNSYLYFKSIAEELRSIAQKRNIIIFSPMQMNRNSINNLESDQSALSDSMGVYMAADSAFIISQTPQYKEENKMRINFVKNRMSGRTNFFEIGYDYSHFRVDDRYFMGGENITAQETKDPISGGFNKLNVDISF